MPARSAFYTPGVISSGRNLAPWATLGPALLLASACAGCGAASPAPAVGLSSPATRAGDRARSATASEAATLLPSHEVGALDDDGGAASLARLADGRSLLVFASAGALRARPLDARGAPTAEPVVVAPLSAPPTHLVARASGDGFLVAWAVAAGEGHTITAAALDAGGRPRGAPSVAQQLAERAAFVDLVVGPDARFIVHELAGRGSRGAASQVAVTPLSAAGTPSGPAVVVADDVIGWNVVATPHGAAVARVVTPPSAPQARSTPGSRPVADAAPDAAPGPLLGRVEVVPIDARGAAGTPIEVLSRPTANIDVDLAAVGERLLVAWTDAADAQGAATVASVDLAAGKASAPRRLSPAGQDAALVGLWAAPGGAGSRALVAWEPIDPRRDPAAPRRFELASPGGDGAPSPAAGQLPFVGPGRPDVVADGEGFAALVLAPADDGSGAVWPTFARLAPDLTPRAELPLRAEAFAATGGVPDLAFGLACSAGACIAVGGAAGAPAPLASIDLSGSADDDGTAPGAMASSASTSPAPAPPASPAPAAASPTGPAPPASVGGAPPARPLSGPDRTSPFWSGERVASVAAARLEGGAELVAWVTSFEPGLTPSPPPPRGEMPFAATLSVGRASGAEAAPVVVSRRAASTGGVALAPVPGAPGEALLGWVASEDGRTQVFATRLDASGKKLAQKKVTVIDRGPKDHPRSAAAAVDLAYSPQASDGRPGVVIAWVDTRDGDAEVYAARLDARLQKVGADRRITAAPGAATEVRVLVRGAETWLAFVEARDGASQGDPYVVRLHTGNLDPIDEAVRVDGGPGAARGLRFVEGPGGRVFLSWVDAPAGAGRAVDAAGARLVELEDGTPKGAPRRIASLGGGLADVAVTCAAGPCRALGAAAGASPRLLAVDLDAAAAPARQLGIWSGDHAHLAPVAPDGAAWVVADADARGGRLRLVRPAW